MNTIDNIENLGAFKGISTLTAMTVLSEIGDFSRFEKPTHFASYIGLVPSEFSSGSHTARGGITKTGNKVVRTALIEATQSIVRGSDKKSKALLQRQKGLEAAVISYADRAIQRIRKKFFSMISRGVSYNKAITACARELACFIWGMMTKHTETRELNMFGKAEGCDPLTGEVHA